MPGALATTPARWLVILPIAIVIVGGCRRRIDDAIPVGWNVLVVTFDTTRADRLGCYGYDLAQTPNIDALARSGTVYTHCYATAPLTLPSHTSLFTGLYAFRHGLTDNGLGPLDPQVVTLAEGLRENGYRTGAVIGAFVLSGEFGLAQGFDDYLQDAEHLVRPSEFHYAERDATAVTDSALAWLDERARQPWFLWVHYFDPHAPYHAPGFVPGMDPSRAYDLEIAHADRQLGRLLSRVADREAAGGRETLIVFAADHGEALGDHGEPTHGLFVYNECVHVPLIVTVPGSRHRGTRVSDPVSLVDVYPTLLHRLGIDLPYDVDGRLLPEPGDSAGERRAVYFENVHPYHRHGWSKLYGMVVEQTKFIEAPTPELYDLNTDPAERRNLAGDEPELTRQLQDAIRDLRASDSGVPTFAAGGADLDQDDVRKLEALGYVGTADDRRFYEGPLPDPKDLLDVHVALIDATAALSGGRTTKAVNLLRGCLHRDPDNRRCLHLLMDLLDRKPIRSMVTPILEDRLRSPLRPPFDHLVPLRLAVAIGKEGRIADSKRWLEVALAANPDDAEAHFFMGQALLRLGGSRESVERHLTRAFDMDPANPLYGIELARWLRGNGAFGRMAAVLAKFVRQHADHAYAHYGLGIALRETGDATGSKAALARAIELAGAEDRLWLDDAKRLLGESGAEDSN